MHFIIFLEVLYSMLNADALYWASKLQEKLKEQKQTEERLTAITRQSEVQIQNLSRLDAPFVAHQIVPQITRPVVYQHESQRSSLNTTSTLKTGDVLSFVRDFIRKFQVSPTRKEIREGLQCSHHFLKTSLAQLNREGRLNIEYGRVRGITLPQLSRNQKMALSYVLDAGIETAPHEVDTSVYKKLR